MGLIDRLQLAKQLAGFEYRNTRAEYQDRGQATNLVGLFLGLLVAGIVAMAVFIPVWNDVVNEANLSGTEETIATYIPLFAVLLLLIAMISPLRNRVG